MITQTIQRDEIAEFEAFLTLPENRDRLFELIDGEIREKMPTQLHGVIAARLSAHLVLFTDEQGFGWVASEVRHQLPDDDQNSRLPDLSYYADSNQAIVERGATPYLPDLAIEIQSPDDSLKLMREKASYYLQNGSKMVWLIYPQKRLVEVYTPDSQHLLTEEDVLEGGEVLRGFRLSVKTIFKINPA